MKSIHMGALSALAWSASLLALMPTQTLAAESPLAQAIARLNADLRQEREIRLDDLGINDPIVLSASDARRELYLPVPAGVPLTDAALTFDASYLNGEGGRNTLLLSLDGYPVRAQGLSEAQGDASATLGVDKAPRDSGSVRLGVAWSSRVERELCEDERAIGNVLRIQPDTRLTYSYDARQLRDIGAAWNALPGKPGVLIAPGTLSTASYDAVWRLGVALERIGKQARILPLPGVGDTVELNAQRVPEALRGVPAFASLDGQGRYTLKSAAEVGALLVLGKSASVQADLAIDDVHLLKAIDTALDALQAEVQALDTQAATALGQWREQHIRTGLGALGKDEARLALLGTRPMLLIAPTAIVKAMTLFNSAWNKLARNHQLTIAEARLPLTQDGRLALSRLGGSPGGLDLLAKSDWSATFPLGNVAYDGRLPVRAVIDVASAPGASSTAPVASVFLNDYLIGAAQLVSDGQKQRIEARIPAYALGSRNVLRVSFQRQPVSNRCLETPQAFPVSVLPTSHIVLEKSTPGSDFAGMAARFAQQTLVLVPQAWLDHPASSLPTLIKIADATGVSPLRAQLSVQADDKTALNPDKPFLAFELPIKDGAEALQVDAQGRLLINHKEQRLLDLQQLDSMAALQVVKAGSQHGVTYRTLGGQAPQFKDPLLLTRGNASILGAEGALSTFDTHDPSGSQLIDADEPRGVDAWRQPSLLWLIPAGVLLFVLLLLAGRRARRNRQ
ncbi:cellulose biosynthesis cyclic di-GMP-binding regulatory protein BcsB [Pseudomonas syringae]|nr:cellulose biosynthesis cyclic di-GMP-binding regulatory protein BcsB [Pseudomonas syringae]MBD8577297.1 cellulose biosynthesis cyclic di-GMP-binding regulatory protein BcsB [Pseudomonas syringae]MBD8793121.1 cellulose biosynthesis cyclic di-GMP-binding regulatory protein BcsB [Pseudomonas syringae]MBD8802906.1 cellulose biosynthesis cyclic di-GMP-binding regulatory protein BcsB [Pseudomonas syringae]MBD8813618.1 cellulose biosynthesis cyclic di-GMP-binding regulatory protein BcsB [Pseudomona